MSESFDLASLREGYQPNDRARRALIRSGLVVVGNEITGSGKDHLIKAIIGLPGSNFGFVPSRKTRKPRGDEVLGVDFVRSPIATSVKQVEAGNYIEWEPLRGTEINGTHMKEIIEATKRGVRPIKDVEPAGQVALRGINPDLKAIYPLPDLDNWLEMHKNRERLPGGNIKAFITGDFTSSDFDSEDVGEQDWFTYANSLLEKRKDVVSRLKVATNQWEAVWRLGLHKEPNTLFVVNTFGGIARTAALAHSFISHGRGLQHDTSPQCMQGEQVLDYLGEVADIAEDVLAAAA